MESDANGGAWSGGECAELAARPSTFAVASATASERNTLRTRLQPIAHLRIDDLHFAVRTSFLTPRVRTLLADFVGLARHLDPMAKLAVFGHDDRSLGGTVARQLSSRRALAVYAILADRPDMWEMLYDTSSSADPWSAAAPGVSMLDGLNAMDPSWDLEANSERDDRALASHTTQAYLRLLRTDPRTGTEWPAFPVDRFLGLDPDLRGSVQGCSGYNPLVVLAREAYTNASQRLSLLYETSVNRRVAVLAFPASATFDSTKWPCPAYDGEVAPCEKRLWSDAASRRQSQPGLLRRHASSDRTFECRFYERLVEASPIEREGMLRPVAKISVLLRSNSGVYPLRHRAYELHLDEGVVVQGMTDDRGWVFHPHVTAGTYRLEIDGMTIQISTLPEDAEEQLVRVEGYMIDERQR